METNLKEKTFLEKAFLKITSILTSFLGLAFCMSLLLGSFSKAKADETTGEKIENKVDDVKKDMRKEHRKAKRSTRKAMGNDSILKDAKDGVDDASDEVSTEAKKLKRKAD